MILVFLGSPRAMIAVVLSVPLSMVVCLLITDYTGGSINTMILGGLALVFSRLIDNGVIVLENIFRHMEMGESPAGRGGSGRNRGIDGGAGRHLHHLHRVLSGDVFHRREQVHLYSLALGVVLSIFASYFFAMTVVPLFCAKFIRLHQPRRTRREPEKLSFFTRFDTQVQREVSDHAGLV